MPVSPRVERTGTVIGPERVFDSTVSTRSAGVVDAVTLAGIDLDRARHHLIGERRPRDARRVGAVAVPSCHALLLPRTDSENT